ncbi:MULTISPECIES: hypothetical protein [unclassified Simplicispira]|uniref:hypothetical protein n=1 Tax=unclassified Simplicispira TaxID=2630407 RepID=UPI000D5CF323|nr:MULTISPECIES: hypothetical protein [unclassified Simplicispira]PVY58377.1 hypothetical protein C8D04_3696 [Simplicispira sp. 125]REG15743.1 hypothetical protein C8D01_0279 [Simplicispira sp. 110]
MHDDYQSDNSNEGEYEARTRLERGDGGYRPDENFPRGLGSSDAAKIFYAVHGDSKELHDRALMQEFLRTSLYLDARVHQIKRYSPRKKSVYAAENIRMSQITEISIDDPYANPRDISRDEFIDQYSAVAFANHKGFTLNVHLTISWELLGVMPKRQSREKIEIHDSFLHPLRDWMKKRSQPFFWIYSNERSKAVGFHTHYLIHVPEHLATEFNEYITKRLNKINKLPSFNEKSFDIKFDKRMDLFKQWLRFQYLCKGVSRYARISHKNSVDKVYLEDLVKFGYENPGDLREMRRIAHSANLNKDARDSHRFKSLMEKGELDVIQLYPQGKVTPDTNREAASTRSAKPLNPFLRFETLGENTEESQIFSFLHEKYPIKSMTYGAT